MLIIFFLATAVHLYGALITDQHLRNLTKPFILAGLLGYYCFSAEKIVWTVVLALFFSWLGDVLLIPEGNGWFTIGGISFLISHFFFVLSYLPYIVFPKIPVFWLISLPLFFLAIVIFIFNRLRPYLPKALFYPMLLYLFINGTMNCFAIFRFLSTMTAGSLITLLGAFLFFISDTVLFFVRFVDSGGIWTHFLVMLTYSIGELLIVLGLLKK